MDTDIADIRREAGALVSRSPEAIVVRECWNCFPEVNYLRNADDIVVLCSECHHLYFKGVDLSI